jgi:CheY-like chemotaxis protein
MSETTSRFRSALSILLIQADPPTVRLTRMALDDVALPKRIHHVAHGEGALSILDDLAAGSNAIRVDLVLLDLQLPAMGGAQTLSAIKAHACGKDLPVLLMAGMEHTGRYVRSLSAYTVIRTASDAASVAHMSACFQESFTAIMKGMKRFN